jgi:hypothetical protein
MGSLFGQTTLEEFLSDVLDRTPTLRKQNSSEFAYDTAFEYQRSEDWDEQWVVIRDALVGTSWVEHREAVLCAALALMTHDLVGVNGYTLEHFFSLLQPLLDLFN